MKYFCPKCNKSYTLPVGDQMIKHKIKCCCGLKAKRFEVTDNIMCVTFPEKMAIIRN